MTGDPPPIGSAREPTDDWYAAYLPPQVDLEPLADPRAWEALRSGERFADLCEEALASSGRMRGAIDVSLAEGLAALQLGDRLAELGYHLGDYAREVLGIEPRTAYGLTRYARALRERPILRRAVWRGEVRRSAAEAILPVARGDAEGYWVCRARTLSVRALKAEVERAGSNPAEAEEEVLRFRARCTAEERALVDEALAVAGEVLPGSTRGQRLEAMAQEFVAGAAAFLDEDAAAGRPERLRREGAWAERRNAWAAQLERETERWAFLPELDDLEAPDIRWAERTTARDVDSTLRKLAHARREWDRRLGHYALLVQRAGLHTISGFADFRHYCEERLGVPPRAIEQRVAVERRLWAVPELRAASADGLSYEKLRALARLDDGEIAAWLPRAREVTAIALRRELEGQAERQMSAQGTLAAPLPRSAVEVLEAALAAVRSLAGCKLPDGKCLAFIARHFLETWKPLVKGPTTLSQKVRARDGGRCLVPGCSHAAMHAHHGVPRAQGGTDDLHNLLSLCVFHHLRCVHLGYLRVTGEAPGGLRWFVGGAPFHGMPS